MFKVLIFISRVTEEGTTSQSHLVEFDDRNLANTAADQVEDFNRDDPHHRAVAIRLYSPSAVW